MPAVEAFPQRPRFESDHGEELRRQAEINAAPEPEPEPAVVVGEQHHPVSPVEVERPRIQRLREKRLASWGR